MRLLVLGAGMAGLGAATRAAMEGASVRVFDKRTSIGGHASSVRHAAGWVFDEGPHISFTKDDRIRDLFAGNVEGRFEAFQAKVNNLWRGHWIKHPAQVNLHGLPASVLLPILEDLVRAQFSPSPAVDTYEDWLVASYGRAFAEAFPMQYGRKYHTVAASHMTTDWVGPRLYRPSLSEVLRGALDPDTEDVHYITEFRYPSEGGFASFVEPFARGLDVQLSSEVAGIDPRSRTVRLKDGRRERYDGLVSTMPLPDLVARLDGVPEAVRSAAHRLACSTCVIVNIGLDREDISEYHWTYFYDDDYAFSRVSFPHMFSRANVPPGKGSIQAEVYYSDKYLPLTEPLHAIQGRVVADLIRCGLIREGEPLAFVETTVARHANVIFDRDRPAAVTTIREYLAECAIESCGRYGDWSYAWTDEAFTRGEEAASRTIDAVVARRA